MEHNVEILRAGSEHVDLVAPLFDAYRRFYQQESNISDAIKFLSDRISGDQSVIFLALVKKKPSGFTQLYPSYTSVSMRKIWILNDLFVEKDARGLGVGKKLIKSATEFARQTGAKKLTLATARDNIPAQKLYDGSGWSKQDSFLHYDFDI